MNIYIKLYIQTNETKEKNLSDAIWFVTEVAKTITNQVILTPVGIVSIAALVMPGALIKVFSAFKQNTN